MTEHTTPAPTAGFGDLAEFFDGALRLPWRGKTYVIPEPDYQLGLKATAVVEMGARAHLGGEATDRDRELLSDGDEREFFPALLGPTHDELVADGASWPVVRRFGITALLYFTVGTEAAMAAWAGKAPAAPNRETRRAAAKKPGKKKASGSRAASSATGRKARPGSTAGSK